MHLDWWTLALQTVNFAVLIWLLRRFLYRPVLRVIDAREAAIRRRYDEAEALDGKAKAELAELDAVRAGIAAEREAALKAASAQALEVAQTQRAQAEQEAQALLSSTRDTLAGERKAALDEVRGIALDLGAAVARRLLDELPARLRDDAWMERVTQHLQALPKRELDALKQQSSASVLRVVTATALSPSTSGQWRARLRELLGPSTEVVFEVDSQLVAGAELHFPQTVLQFSWQSVLGTLRGQIDAHAH